MPACLDLTLSSATMIVKEGLQLDAIGSAGVSIVVTKMRSQRRRRNDCVEGGGGRNTADLSIASDADI